MKGVLAGYGIELMPFQLSVWAIPSAVAAFLIHGARLLWLDHKLGRAPMIGLGLAVYAVAGTMFLLFAALSLRARRLGHAGFYALLATSFLAGDRIGDIGNGVLVLGLVGIAASGLLKPVSPPEGEAPHPRGNAIFLAALVIPATALLGTLAFPRAARAGRSQAGDARLADAGRARRTRRRLRLAATRAPPPRSSRGCG